MKKMYRDATTLTETMILAEADEMGHKELGKLFSEKAKQLTKLALEGENHKDLTNMKNKDLWDRCNRWLSKGMQGKRFAVPTVYGEEISIDRRDVVDFIHARFSSQLEDLSKYRVNIYEDDKETETKSK